MEFGRVKLNIYRTLRDLLHDAAVQFRLLLLHLVNSCDEFRVLHLQSRVLLLQLIILDAKRITNEVEDPGESFLPKIEPEFRKKLSLFLILSHCNLQQR